MGKDEAGATFHPAVRACWIFASVANSMLLVNHPRSGYAGWALGQAMAIALLASAGRCVHQQECHNRQGHNEIVGSSLRMQ
jgi:hypothetical protein